MEKGEQRSSLYGVLDADAARSELRQRDVAAEDFRSEPLTLEDTFIALTGKY